MLYLAGSIVLTSWLTLSFKVAERFRIPMLQAIVVNYWVCVATGSIVNGSSPFTQKLLYEKWFGWAGAMGVTFIFLFTIIGITTQKMGVSVASVANKLSLVIPFVFSLYLYNESFTFLKIAGVAIALVAVVFTCWPSGRKEPSGKSFGPVLFLLPFILFLGSGLLDTMIKYAESRFLDGTNNNDFLITAFAFAGTAGIIALAILMPVRKERFDFRSVVAGLAIGIPNYFSIWCLVHVLKDYAADSSKIIPINNMGIVLFSTLVAWLVFKEKLSFLNRTGIILSVAAIALIAYG